MSAAPERPFTEPWQATAFALTISLHETGLFTWPEWTAALTAQINDHPDADYYECWLLALEALLTTASRLEEAEIDRLQHAWLAAAAATPHGQPINLAEGALHD